MTNFNQLIEEKRESIQYMINESFSFTKIAKAIGTHRTTVYRELTRNSYLKSNIFEAFDEKGMNKAKEDCFLLQSAPYVCNPCPKRRSCNKHKIYYNSKIANSKYKVTLKTAREGIDITPGTIEEIELAIVPLIKNKRQSVNQVYANHQDILYFSKPTFYKYVDLGILSLTNLDLPKKVKYKVRKKKYEEGNKRGLALLKGRSYKEYLEFTIAHPNMNIMEMDTVEGNRNSSKVLLTLILKKTKFMIMYLLDKQNVACVNDSYNKLKNYLGINLYAKVFRVILTDNGHEFFNPLGIELDYATGKKVCNLFYCEPYSSWQKGTIEKNHQYIRKVFPKGTSFDNLSVETLKKLEDNINNIPRVDLDNKTPYELTKKLYPELINKLDSLYVNPDDVSLNPDDYKGEM